MKTLTHTMMVALLCGAAACTQTTTGGEEPERGTLRAVLRAGFVDVQLDADAAPLSLAATVTISGAAVTGEAQLGDAAAGRNLLKQRNAGNGTVRFVVSDTRALRLLRSGTVVRIPVSTTPSRVDITDITAGDENGRSLRLKPFSGTPGAP